MLLHGAQCYIFRTPTPLTLLLIFNSFPCSFHSPVHFIPLFVSFLSSSPTLLPFSPSFISSSSAIKQAQSLKLFIELDDDGSGTVR